MKQRLLSFLVLVLLFLPQTLSSQENILRLAPYSVSGQFLNNQIAQDTVTNGKLANRVYILQRGGTYLANAVFTVPGGWTLKIRGNDSLTSAKPIIMLYPMGTGTTPWQPPARLFDLFGNLQIRNLIINGYSELADTNLRNLQGGLITVNVAATGVSIVVDSCVLSNSSGNHIRTDGIPSVVKVTNTLFANMGYLGGSNLGAGKAIDLRANSVDTVIVQNCTFVNWQDRIIRHLNLGSTTGPIQYFLFDHNTLINGMSFHGLLSLGNISSRAIITNNLMVNPFALGNDTDYVRQAEFLPSGEKDLYGKNRMTWILSEPNITALWTVSNNYYGVSDSSQAFYEQFASAGVGGEGSPLTWYINGRIGADSVKTFKKVRIVPNKIPSLMTKLMRWYRSPSGGNKTKNTPGAWVYGDVNVHPYADPYDSDRKIVSWLQDSLNCSYYASEVPVSTDAKVVGDPRWSFLGAVSWTPSIGSFSPTSGPVGTIVTITGTSFNATAGNNVVYFGAVKAHVNSASLTSLTVTVPTGAAYASISVTDTTTHLTAYSAGPFDITFPSSHSLDTNSLAPKVNFATGLYPSGAALADLDGDGKSDLVVADYNSNTISVYRNIGTTGSVSSSSFGPKVDFPTGAGPHEVVIADVDGDGKLDIVVTIYGNSAVAVLRNTCSIGSITAGSFASEIEFTTGSNPYGLAMSDMDGDGKPDIIVANSGTNTVSILRSTVSTGTITATSFASKVDFVVGSGPVGIATGDLNGDGKPEFVVTNPIDNTVSVFRNTSIAGTLSTSSFATRVDFAAGLDPQSVALADMDGDGKLDLVVTDYASSTISVMRNLSAGGVITSSSLAPKIEFAAGGSTPRILSIADIDGDGKPDILAAFDNDNRLSILRNLSTVGSISAQSFAGEVHFATGTFPLALPIGDIDGDGKPDITVTAANSNFVSVFRNAITPQKPQNLGVTGGNAQATLKWNKIAENRFLRYRIYMGADSTAVSLKDSSTASITDTTKTITGLTNGAQYYFRVSALDSSRVESPQSYSVGVVPANNLLTFQANMRIAIKKGRFIPSTDSVIVRGTYNGWIANTDRLLDPNTDSTYTGTFDVGSATPPEYKFVIRHLGQDNWERQSTGNRSYTPTGNPQTLPVFFFDDDSIPPGVPPTITSFSPVAGPIGSGVTITGTSFNPVLTKNIVYFGAVKTTVASGGTTALFVKVPTGATYAPITVTDTTTHFMASSAQPFVVTFPSSQIINTTSFAAKSDFTTGSGPFSVAINDLDGDGKPDLIVTDFTGNAVSVFRNTSTTGSLSAGSFAAKVDFTTGSSPYSVAIGDVDGDGKPDLIVANFSSNTVSVFRNTSTTGSITTGSFAAKVDFTTGTNPYSIAISDVDGDGKPDLVVANYPANTVSVLRNTSTPGSITASSFASKVDFTTGAAPDFVAIGDVDGDGKTDIVVANNSGNSVSILRNTSTPGSITASSFASNVDFATGTTPRSVVIGDVDGDGKLDLVIANGNSTSVSILRNTSTPGSITASSFASKVDFAAGSSPVFAAIGDLDGDGKPDFVVTNQSSNTVSVFRNTSTPGSITASSFASKVDFTTGTAPQYVAIGDLDGDGKPDLAVVNYNSSTVSVVRNTVAPQTPQNLTVVAGNGQVSLKWYKIAENRFLRYRIYRGTSSGGEILADSSTASIFDTTKVMTGLVNGTTYYVRVTAMDSSRLESVYSNEVRSTPNNPYATFTQPLNNLGITDTVGQAGFAWGDFDGDGYLDLFLSGQNRFSVLYKNTGTVFSKIPFADDSTQLTAGAVWADFTGDGKLDLLYTDGSTLKLYQGAGNGQFTDITASSNLSSYNSGTGQLWMASAADFERDGDLDIVFAGGNSVAGPIRLLQNSGGVFTDVSGTVLSSNSSFESWNPAWVDINNDGNLDLWIPTIRTPSQACALYIKQGSTFILSNPATTGLNAPSAVASAWGDYDNDGYMDLFLIPFSGDNVGVAKLYHNNGNGTFTDVAHSMGLDSAFADSRGVCWGDYDNDGRLDLLIGRRDNQQQLWRNTGTMFVEVGGPAGIAAYGDDSRSVMFVDQNNDGFLDIFLAGQNNPKVLFQNNGGNSNHWIGIKPVGMGNNKSAIGARVRIATGATRQARDIQAGGTGGMTNGNIWANFGLGATTSVDSVIILWPDGLTETFKNPPIDKYNMIVRGTSILPPVITAFSPTSGSVGTSVSITGNRFNATASKNFVFVGGIKAPVASGSSTSLTITIPQGASSSLFTVADSATHLTGYSRTPFAVTFVSTHVIDSSSFASKVDTSTGNGPRGVAIADFDGDGKNDLAVVNYTDNTVALLRNTSTSGVVSLASKLTAGTGVNPINVATGDFDGDGKIDLVVSNLSSNTVSILRNTSTPGVLSFASKIDSSTGASPYGVAVCDIDGDGKPDIVVANTLSNTISILKNTSSGSISFAAKVDLPTGSQPYGVTFGDVNNDGLADIVVTGRGDNTITIYVNNSVPGILSVTASTSYTTGTNPDYVVAGDLDGDLLPDLATSNIGSQTISMFRNMTTSGSVSFATRIDSSTGTFPYNLALGDFDGDGKSDLAVCANAMNSISVHRNTSGAAGSVSFSSYVNFATGSSPRFVAVGDIDGDGKPDLVAANYSANTVSVLRNTVKVPSIVSFGVDMSKQRAIGTFQNGDTIKVLVFTPSIGRSTPAQGKVLGISQTSGPTVFRDTINFGTYTGAAEYKFWNSRTAFNIGYEGVVGPGSGANGNRAYTVGGGLNVLPTFFFDSDSAVAITSFTPSSGPIGSSVTISGYRFNATSSNNIVYFGGVKASVSSASASSLTVTVPVGATFAPILVTDTTTDRTAYSKSPFVVTFSSSRVINTSSFAAKVDSSVGTGPRGSVVGDFDGDGKNDVAVVNYSSNSVTILRNNGSSGIVSFPTKTTLTAGTNPINIAAGDFDGDGRLDLVVTNYSVNTISIFKNFSTPGNISFAAKFDSTTGLNPYGVAIQDIDGDGKPDIVVANINSNSFSVFRNTSSSGTISFAPRADFTTGSSPYGVVLADINGDGSPDVIITNWGANTVSVFRNTSAPGALSFTAPLNNPTGVNPNFVVVGDLDGDNLSDLVTSNSGGSISILRNTTSGGAISFAAKIDSSVSTIPYNVALADLDGDGRLDIVVSNSGLNSLTVYKNKSNSGAISVASAVNVPAGLSPRFVSVGDLDGDGKPDLVGANFASNTVSTIRNTVSAAVPPAISSFSPISGPTGTTVSIAGTNFNTIAAANRVYFGPVRTPVTSASSTSLSVNVPTGTTYSRISVTDTTTGLTDYSNLSFTPTFVSNQSIDASTFAPKSDIAAASSPWSMQAVDVDGDGKTDLVVANDAANSISVYRNTSSLGNITFAARLDSSLGAQPKYLTCGDLDGDGKQDFLTTNQSANTLSIYRNTSSLGAVSFAPKIALTDTGGPFNAAIGDIDGDGKLDIVVANISTNKISVLRNTSLVGSIAFANPLYFTANTSVSGVAVGDIDGDGLPDVVAVNSGANSITILRNTSTSGNITFATGLEYIVGPNTAPWMVCLGDLDLDGKLDILVINNSGNSLSIFRNLSSVGAIAINAGQNQAINASPWSMTLGDINGDGKPDIIVGYQGLSKVSVLKNTSISGSISLAPKIDYTTTGNAWGVVAADLDGDGKPDLAATNYSASTVSILRNTESAFNWASFGVDMSRQRACGSLQTGDTVRVLIFSPASLNRSLPSAGKILGIAPASGADVYRDTVNMGNYTGIISYKFWKSRGVNDSVRYEQPYGATGNRAFTVGPGSNTLSTVYFSADSVGAPIVNAATNIQSSSFRANWGAVTGATGYQLDVSTSSSFATYLSGYQNKNAGTLISSTVTGLAGKTSYCYRVRAIAANGTSINSNIVWVTTSSPPLISSFSPTSGTIGSTVTISGSGFDATASNNVVYFGAVSANVTSATTNSLFVIVPSGAIYSPITVSTGGLTASSSKPFFITFQSGQMIDTSSFEAKVDFSTGSSSSGIAIADLDGDGKVDILVTSSTTNTLSALRNTGTSGNLSFASKTDFATGTSPTGVETGDIDGDGKPDIVVANYGSNSVSVFRNTCSIGSISFGAKTDFATGGNPMGVGVADIDGDGKLDIVCSNYGSNSISVLRNTSIGVNISFDAKVDFGTGSNPASLVVGDIDGDGKLDVVVTNYNGNSMSLFRNTSSAGAVSFAAKTDYQMPSVPYSITLADLDGDGRQDIVAAVYSSTVSVFRNTSNSGTISFATRADFAAGNGPRFIDIGDMDGDGKPDLAVTNANDFTVSVYRNTSSTSNVSFVPKVDFGTGNNPGALAVGDIDLDGMPDLAVVNASGSSISILRNSVSLVPPTITVETMSCNWATTFTYGIKWSSQNLAGSVNIRLSLDNGSTFPITIVSGLANTGKYSWTIPSNQQLSSTCILRVEAATNATIYAQSGVFAIVKGDNVIIRQPATVIAAYSSSPTNNAEYRLVSYPGNVDGIPVSQLGLNGSQDNNWKMFREPGNAAQGFVAMGTGTSLKTGEGYWYIQKGYFSKSVSFNTPTLDNDATVLITLSGGPYSIVGNPFNVPIPWSAVLAVNGLASTTPLFSWNGKWSSSDSLLLPGVGYYINSSGMSTLRIPYAAFGFPSQIPGEQLSADWRLRLVFESELNRDDDNYIGIARGTSIGKDRFEFNKPPLIFDESFVYMKRPAWNTQNDLFYSDYRPEVGEGQTWDFQITNPSKSLGRLSVTGVEDIPSTQIVYLVNEETGVTSNLRRQDWMQYGYGRTTGHFKVVVGPQSYVSQQLEKYMPKEFSLEQNYPNPFNPSTTVTFKMPKDGSVRLEVFSLLGQRIRVLAEGPYEAGVHQVVWMGDNDRGARVASGVYFCRFVNGNNSVQTKKMLLTK